MSGAGKLSPAVVVREVPDDGWLLSWGDGRMPEHFPVAVKALNAIKERDARLLAEEGISTITVVTWDTVTNVGAAIARAMGVQ